MLASGVATVSEYEAAIQSVTYLNTSESPSIVTRTVEIVVNDADLASNALSRDIEVIAVNDAPVASLIEASVLAYTESSGPNVISSTLSLSDIDDVNLDGATVQISANYISGEDELAVTGIPGISTIWDASTGTLTLSGSGSVAVYETALRAVTYENLSDNPAVNPRTVSFSVFDGNVDSDVQTRELTVVPVNNAPALTSIEAQPASYTENGTAIAVTANLSIADVDDLLIESATVTIGSKGGNTFS